MNGGATPPVPAWAPDGRGLPAEAAAIVALRGDTVHLRLSAPGRHPVAACGMGLGGWWSGDPAEATGDPAEATCAGCLLVRPAGGG